MINLIENEKIIMQKRRHWYALASEAAGLLLAAFAPFFLLALALSTPTVEPLVFEFWGLVLFAISTWMLMMWMVFFVVWTNYYLDVFILTNYRIIDIEQKGLFARDMVEVHLLSVEDIKIEVSGILPTLMNFGDLYVQTAGVTREVIIRKIPNPAEVREVVAKYHTEMLNRGLDH
ncbi:MAG: PH domain-containing protein [Candidatus Spechtbacterales bacterium]|nr:PH domain-containing protein [Candidatus Spechtbacterales bacterium]